MMKGFKNPVGMGGIIHGIQRIGMQVHGVALHYMDEQGTVGHKKGVAIFKNLKIIAFYNQFLGRVGGYYI